MAIGDIPRLPDKDLKRVEQLVKKVKSGETPPLEVLEKSLAALGRFKLDRSGFEIKDRFKIGREELETLFDAAAMSMKGSSGKQGGTAPKKKQSLCIDLKELGRFKVQPGFPPKAVPISKEEIEQTDGPVIELDLDLIPFLFQGFEGLLYLSGERLVTVRGGKRTPSGKKNDGWQAGVNKLNAALPLMSFSTRKFLGQLGEPLTAFCDEVLTKCGV